VPKTSPRPHLRWWVGVGGRRVRGQQVPQEVRPRGSVPVGQGGRGGGSPGGHVLLHTHTWESGSPTPHHMGRSEASIHRGGASTSSLGVAMYGRVRSVVPESAGTISDTSSRGPSFTSFSRRQPGRGAGAAPEGLTCWAGPAAVAAAGGGRVRGAGWPGRGVGPAGASTTAVESTWRRAAALTSVVSPADATTRFSRADCTHAQSNQCPSRAT
jgi:hypothetical protein